MFIYLVQGTYSGAGSFSASAQTADKERSAQAQVNRNSIDIVDFWFCWRIEWNYFYSIDSNN